MSKLLARLALAVIAVALFVPAAFVRVHFRNSLLWAGHHPTLLSALLAICVTTAIVLAGGLLCLFVVRTVIDLFKAAFPRKQA